MVQTPPVQEARRPRNRRGQGHLLAEEILVAAQQIIEETGDEAHVTLSELARRVGISAPSIYDHFASAAAIRQAVVGRCWSAYDATVLKQVDNQSPVAAQVRQWAHLYIAFSRDHWGMYRTLFSRDSPTAVEDVGRSAQEYLAALVAGLTQILGVEQGSPDADDAALGLWIELHGIAVLPPAHPRFPWPPDQELVEKALHRCGVPNDTGGA